MKKYTLVDCLQMHKKYPKTFEIPTMREKFKLKKGSLVKLIFESEDGPVERMWVKIKSIGLANWVGILDNDPIFIPIKRGARVKFQLKNVVSIWEDEAAGVKDV